MVVHLIRRFCVAMQIVEWKKKPIVSATLVIINVIVYIICTFTGNLLYNMGRSSVLNVLVD